MTVHISVPLDEAQKAQLEAIAKASQESVGELAARAVRAFLEEDAAFRAAVDEGLADVRAGRVR